MAWYKSQAALIVGSLLLALGLVFTALSPLSRYCKPETPRESKASAKNSADTAKPSSKKPTVAQILESIHQTQKTQYESEERAKQEKSWWHAFACEMKITDFFIATFTLWLVIIGAWQGWQLQRTVDLSRSEFINANRPVLSVRREQVRWDKKGINFVLANTGNLLATEIIGSISIKVVPASKASDFEKESLPPYEHIWVHIGERLVKAIHKTPNLGPSQRAFIFWESGDINETSKALIENEQSVLYFYGLINCKDPGGTRRETAFFRTYDPRSDTFKAKDDPDYERTT